VLFAGPDAERPTLAAHCSGVDLDPIRGSVDSLVALGLAS
jgi:hypothetical protein